LKVEDTKFKDLYVLNPTVHGDHRGFFIESYNANTLKELGISYTFVQDNRSFSKKGILRGLHFQTGESAQTKLVTCLSGKVLDVVVDMRQGSKTYGQHFSIELCSEKKNQLLIPRGFAHGFIVLTETAEFFYKCDNFYNPSSEQGLMYNDPDLCIDWKLSEEEIILSDKDEILPAFSTYFA
jgi:dTDP-4-dehydrorhamnose 3,5-epimerase